jgi:hypothetical protein
VALNGNPTRRLIALCFRRRSYPKLDRRPDRVAPRTRDSVVESSAFHLLNSTGIRGKSDAVRGEDFGMLAHSFGRSATRRHGMARSDEFERTLDARHLELWDDADPSSLEWANSVTGTKEIR